MDKKVIIKRLTLIKYLFIQGVEQSKKPEQLACFSVLTFHDAVEMFLKLAVQTRGKDEQFGFMKYWNEIEGLTLRDSMNDLNNRRNNLKHKGLMPSKDDVETSRVITRDFLHQNTPNIFEYEFSEISLLDLLSFKSTKEYLKEAHKNFESEKFKESIEQSSYAFEELINEYKSNKMGNFRRDPFELSSRISNPINEYTYGGDQKHVRNFDDLTSSINKNLESISKVVQLIALGIDYRKYVKFDTLTPRIYQESNGRFRTISESKDVINNATNAEYCMNFALESGILLQEVDFELKELKIEPNYFNLGF